LALPARTGWDWGCVSLIPAGTERASVPLQGSGAELPVSCGTVVAWVFSIVYWRPGF